MQITSSEVREIYDAQLVNFYLEREKYHNIIGSKKLFLATFYTMYKGDSNLNFNFKVSVLEDEIIKVTGDAGAIFEVKKVIEKIRQFLLGSIKEQSPFVNIVVIENGQDIHLENEKPLRNIYSLNLNVVPIQFYEHIILPNLPRLAKACDLIFSETTEYHNIITGYGLTKAKFLHFEWQKGKIDLYIKLFQNLGLD